MNFRVRTIALFAFLLLSSCAPNLGSTIEAPQVPAQVRSKEARARMGSMVGISEIIDGRTGVVANDDETYTEPYGGIQSILETALKQALVEAGVAVSESANLGIHLEVKTWRAKITRGALATVDAEASVELVLKDSTGKRIYNGTYKGTRSKQFPVLTKTDIRDSLGLAMSNAIDEISNDTELLDRLN